MPSSSPRFGGIATRLAPPPSWDSLVESAALEVEAHKKGLSTKSPRATKLQAAADASSSGAAWSGAAVGRARAGARAAHGARGAATTRPEPPRTPPPQGWDDGSSTHSSSRPSSSDFWSHADVGAAPPELIDDYVAPPKLSPRAPAPRGPGARAPTTTTNSSSSTAAAAAVPPSASALPAGASPKLMRRPSSLMAVASLSLAHGATNSSSSPHGSQTSPGRKSTSPSPKRKEPRVSAHDRALEAMAKASPPSPRRSRVEYEELSLAAVSHLSDYAYALPPVRQKTGFSYSTRYGLSSLFAKDLQHSAAARSPRDDVAAARDPA